VLPLARGPPLFGSPCEPRSSCAAGTAPLLSTAKTMTSLPSSPRLRAITGCHGPAMISRQTIQSRGLSPIAVLNECRDGNRKSPRLRLSLKTRCGSVPQVSRTKPYNAWTMTRQGTQHPTPESESSRGLRRISFSPVLLLLFLLSLRHACSISSLWVSLRPSFLFSSLSLVFLLLLSAGALAVGPLRMGSLRLLFCRSCPVFPGFSTSL